MGQSGGGKSTLLRLVLGILQPTKGTVRFQRRSEINKMGRRELNAIRARKMGMVYQYSALISSSLNVRDNLALPMEELTDKTEAEIEKHRGRESSTSCGCDHVKKADARRTERRHEKTHRPGPRARAGAGADPL